MNKLKPVLCLGFLCTIAISLVITSCEKPIDKQLDEIEQELSADPKSACEKLAGMEPVRFHSKSRIARHALLLSLARDKSYIDVADDSLIQIAVRYYQDRNDPSYKMLSFYSLGRVQRNAKKNTGAIVSFLRAKELAEEIPDCHYWGLAARNMADLYKDGHDYESAREYYQESAQAFGALGDRYYAVYSILGEVESDMALGHYDSADSLLMDLETYSIEERQNSLLAAVLKLQASIRMKPDRASPEEAISLFRQASQLGFPIRNTENYGTIATAFEFLNQQDSVNYYLDLAEKHAKTLVASVHLCNAKSRIYSHRGRYQEANAELIKGVELHNLLVFNRENQQIANAISDYSRQEAERQSTRAHYRLQLLVLSILAIIALSCAIVQILISRKRQILEKNRIILEKERKIEDDIEQIKEISDALQIEKNTQSEMAKAINELIGDKIAIVKICADAYEAVKNDPKETPRDPYRYLDEDPVKKKTSEMKRFLKALDDVRKDDSLFVLLEDSVNRWRKGIMKNLRKACETMARPIFSEDDFRILMLIYAGIPDRTIAFLMDMTCAAVRTRKSRYKDRLVQNDIIDGNYFVQEMAFIDKD